MMTTRKKYLSYRILVCITSLCSHRVVVALLFLRFLPYVICQEEWGSGNGRIKFTVESVIGITLLMLFIISMLAGCLFYAVSSNRGETGGVDVWQSRTSRGLDKDVIESFPVFLYSEVKGLKIGEGGVECAICLSEFEDEEMLRMMPPCSHVFHANCIDVWLSSSSTCPVCRADLSPSPAESFPYPFVHPCSNPNTDPERGSLESPEISLIDSVTRNNIANRPSRSSPTGLSRWRITEIFYPRSHSTGHSKVQLGANLDRFTLQLPEEVRKQLVTLNLIRRSHVALPRARSSRQGYRSGGFGSERSSFHHGGQKLRRSLSMSFSIQNVSVQSSLGKDDPVGSIKVPFGETSRAKNREQSFERLTP